MTSYELLKICHACSALLSVAGFALRSFWLMTHNPLLGARLTKILPHCLDTLLLGTAIALLWQLQISLPMMCVPLWRITPDSRSFAGFAKSWGATKRKIASTAATVCWTIPRFFGACANSSTGNFALTYR